MGKGDFEIKMSKGWEKAVQSAALDGLREIANDYQRMLNRLGRQHGGRPVGDIKPILRREWRRIGGDITDPELTQYAQHISDGVQIQVRTS